jgi:hypothetical protein
MKSVQRAVRTGLLNEAVCAPSYKGNVIETKQTNISFHTQRHAAANFVQVASVILNLITSSSAERLENNFE